MSKVTLFAEPSFELGAKLLPSSLCTHCGEYACDRTDSSPIHRRLLDYRTSTGPPREVG